MQLDARHHRNATTRISEHVREEMVQTNSRTLPHGDHSWSGTIPAIGGIRGNPPTSGPIFRGKAMAEIGPAKSKNRRLAK